jgi:Putative peptidoglycan binding domain
MRRNSLAGAVVLALAVMGSAVGLAAPATANPAGLPTWFLAPSLAALRNEIDRTWPARSRASDGWIGDRAHRRSPSDHNPVGYRNGPSYGSMGSVHALDVTASGIDTSAVLNAVIGDSRVAYVIFSGRIWSASRGWASTAYYGDPHTTHIHISLRGESAATALAAERDTSRWLGSGTRGVSTSSNRTSWAGKYRPGARGSHITEIQRRLNAWGFLRSAPTGRFGKQTRRAVRNFQKALGWHGHRANGLPGKATLKQLGVR